MKMWVGKKRWKDIELFIKINPTVKIELLNMEGMNLYIIVCMLEHSKK